MSGLLERLQASEFLRDVEFDKWVKENTELSELHKLLAERIGGRRASRFVQTILAVLAYDFGAEYMGRFARVLREIGRLRDEIELSYWTIMTLIASKEVTDLSQLGTEPAEIAARMRRLRLLVDELRNRELETEIKARGADAWKAVDQEVVLDELLQTLEGEERPAGPAPTLELEDPELAGWEKYYEENRPDLSEAQRKFAARAARRASQRSQAMSEQDRAVRARWNERVRMFGRDDPAKAQLVDKLAGDLVRAKLLPKGTAVIPRRLPLSSSANIAQLAALAELDPTFLGNGYELKITLPDGRTVMPDGMRLLGTEPGAVPKEGMRYRFLEHKEPYEQGGYYTQPEGRAKLRTMLEKHAGIANDLRANGCTGFEYSTGDPALDGWIAAEIADMRANQFPGADLLIPGAGGE